MLGLLLRRVVVRLRMFGNLKRRIKMRNDHSANWFFVIFFLSCLVMMGFCFKVLVDKTEAELKIAEDASREMIEQMIRQNDLTERALDGD